jgi:hypothetical protein
MLELLPARAEPEVQAAAARVVDGGGHLRQHGGVPVRVPRDEDAEPDAARLGGERGEERPGLELRGVAVAERRDEVVVHPGGVVAERLDELEGGRDLLVGGALGRNLHAEAERPGRGERGEEREEGCEDEPRHRDGERLHGRGGPR